MYFELGIYSIGNGVARLLRAPAFFHTYVEAFAFAKTAKQRERARYREAKIAYYEALRENRLDKDDFPPVRYKVSTVISAVYN